METSTNDAYLLPFSLLSAVAAYSSSFVPRHLRPVSSAVRELPFQASDENSQGLCYAMPGKFDSIDVYV